jgi:hypothetical protein
MSESKFKPELENLLSAALKTAKSKTEASQSCWKIISDHAANAEVYKGQVDRALSGWGRELIDAEEILLLTNLYGLMHRDHFPKFDSLEFIEATSIINP